MITKERVGEYAVALHHPKWEMLYVGFFAPAA
ncbi:hypothetical protein [Coxiella burnetii]|uniref:Uncharacterized protein n=2 Tax=Coxiella burnetii TaxID=777 RepID=Q83F60_COXBU|nr:hypothetical protein [Coxiella burnetii]NP_819141.1 hypothetical protein CBU_0089 [Coxiella burnetii RSA 493]AAO89655.1 hypothetical protein CBU_0089 [Coxiella burnetii RSA 493]ACI23226.1 hypothetical protein CBUD_2019b [Coxiella burnetii Dugway 5J108-111]ACJ19174.1 hypothetical protein CbuG_1929 [Coxiella burnetii CbuG_Q212]ACJ21075.1 hypothetical protein CbuK_1968 [Coxiella burnetii CbuK_Q154]APQ67129.1 hypothetical protein A35_10005 [Coxiella burnetii 'MSU Goat Q177']